MPLPKITVPSYDVVLPSQKKVVKIRPFLVREEKILLMAAETGEKEQILNAIRDVLANCVLTQGIDTNSLPMFDIEYLFLKIRSKSVGEVVTLSYGHVDGVNSKGEECKVSKELKINLEEIEVHENPKHEGPNIKLTDKVGIILKYPTVEMMDLVINVSGYEDGIKMIEKCIDAVYEGEETFSRSDFTDEEISEFILSLNKEQFGKMENFFATMPRVRYEHSYKCEGCKEDVTIVIEGIDDFFG